MADAKGAAAADNAAAGAMADTASQRVVEQQSAQGRSGYTTVRSNEDVGGDERYQVSAGDHQEANFRNEKHDADNHVSWDLETLAYTRRQEIIETELRRRREQDDHEQRMRHVEAEQQMRLRHAEFQVTALAAVTEQMIQDIADATANKVCAKLGK